MMLQIFGEEKASTAIEEAVVRALKSDIKSLDAGKMGMGTREVGDLVAGYV